ncbi:3',5'-cyclic-nucleotide phosphodiesterase [Tanacetum coccineum]
MTISHDSSKTSCFSSILRRVICSNGIPTHPSSDIDNPNVVQIKLHPPSPPAPAPAPANIVARLMGLDSLPNSPHSSKVSLGSLMRKSRSVGSLDFIPNFDITKQPHHRRLRTSLSYREDVTTTFVQTSHNHDQISRNAKTGLTPIQEKPNILNKKRRQCQKVKVNSKKQVSLLPKKITRKKVVDDGFPEKKNKLKSRNRGCNHPLPKATKKKVVDDDKENNMFIMKRRQSEEYCIKVLMEVCRLTMEGIQGNGVSLETTAVNDIKEISYEIGHDILQLLVYEMVDELCISM